MTRKRIQALRVLAKLRGIAHLDYIEYVLDGTKIRRYLHPNQKTTYVPKRAVDVWYGWDVGEPKYQWGPITHSRWGRTAAMYRSLPNLLGTYGPLIKIHFRHDR